MPPPTPAPAISTRLGLSGAAGATAGSTSEKRWPLDITSSRSPTEAVASWSTAALYWPWRFS